MVTAGADLVALLWDSLITVQGPLGTGGGEAIGEEAWTLCLPFWSSTAVPEV